jgi:Tfp pilus assembly protein PilN
VTCIGIGVSPNSVCCVFTRGRAVEWAGIDTVEEGAIDTALGRLLTRLPKTYWPKPAVHVGLAREFSYVKTVHSLPPTRNAKALSRIIALTPSRFFVLSKDTSTVTGVRVLDRGVVRAGVINANVIAIIRDACAAVGLIVVRVIPGDIALSALSDEQQGDPCALALAAASLDRREPVVLRSGSREMTAIPTRRLRTAVASGAAAISVLGMVSVPTILDERHANASQREAAMLSATHARAWAAQQNLNDASRMLVAVSKFENSRSSKVWLLKQLAGALPKNSTILSLKADTTAVTINVLGNNAAEIVRSIQDMPGASSVEMIGPISYEGASIGADRKESDGAQPKASERVTLRFVLAADPGRLRTPLVSENEGKR